MVEGALLTEVAGSILKQIFARLSFVVRVDGAQGVLAEGVGERVVLLSEFVLAVGELAEAFERAGAGLEVVVAHLGLVLPLDGGEVLLVVVEVGVHLLAGVLLHDLAGRVVEVPLVVLVLSPGPFLASTLQFLLWCVLHLGAGHIRTLNLLLGLQAINHRNN